MLFSIGGETRIPWVAEFLSDSSRHQFFVKRDGQLGVFDASKKSLGWSRRQASRGHISMTTATSKCIPANAAEGAANLLPGIRDGDPVAWGEILRRYGRFVSATVQSFRLQEADAFDAIQATWLRLAESAHQVRDPERLGGWLVTTARRECLRILRQTRHGPNLIDMAEETVADPSANPERRTIDAHTSCMLWKLVDELSPRRRAVLRTLFADDPCSYDQVARITGIPLGGIGPTRARALRQLRKNWDQRDNENTNSRETGIC